MKVKQFYILAIGLSLLGYGWIAFNQLTETSNYEGATICVFKKATSIPCPACGASRSVLSISKGDFKLAAKVNPLGYLLLVGLILMPLWAVYDIVTRRKTLYHSFYRMELFVKQRYVAVLLVALVFVNWIWNINKGL